MYSVPGHWILAQTCFGLRRLGIHESQRTNCNCCGLDREGLWCLWSTSGSVPRDWRLQPRVSFKDVCPSPQAMSSRQLVDFQISREHVPVYDAGFDITSPKQQEFLLNVSTEARWRADLKVRLSVLTWIEVFQKRYRANFPFALDAAAPFLITLFR